MSKNYSYPDSLKRLRACLRCHLLKTEDQVRNYNDKIVHQRGLRKLR
jgi:hypothetical protein